MKSFDFRKIEIGTLVLFIFCAVPGALVFVFSSIVLVFAPFDKELSKTSENLYLPFLLMILGAFLLLIGLKKLKQKLYLLVFLALPTVLAVTSIIFYFLGAGWAGLLSLPCFLLPFIAPFTALKYVRKFYEAKKFQELEK